MPMDAHQLKTFLPDIRSRMLQAQTSRNLQKQLSMPPGDPVQTSVQSLTSITFLPRIREPVNSQAGQPFPIRPEVSSRLSMVNQMNNAMREADRKSQETEYGSRILSYHSIPTKASLLQRGMLQGRAFRLPALGTIKPVERTPTPDPKSSASSTFHGVESRQSTEPVDQDDFDGSVETRNTSSLSIEPYPFSEEEVDLMDTPRGDTTYGPGEQKLKAPVKTKRKKRKKVTPKPQVPDPEPAKVKKKKVKRRSWKDVRPVKDLTPLKYAAPTAYDKELDKLLPERKSFFYSGALERELQRNIPPRIPGGKLKPVYRRSADGEIYLPEHPLDIKCHHLIDGSAPKEGQDDKTLTRRPGEDLPSFNERKRRFEMQEEIEKNRTIVSFREPPRGT